MIDVGQTYFVPQCARTVEVLAVDRQKGTFTAQTTDDPPLYSRWVCYMDNAQEWKLIQGQLNLWE